MTVKELIVKLQDLPPDTEVCVWTWGDENFEPFLVSASHIDTATGIDNTIGII